MGDEKADRFFSFSGRIPFAFLQEVHQRFVKIYGRAILSAAPYAMNDEFSRVLSQEMERYSTDPDADRLNRLKGEMSQVTQYLSFRGKSRPQYLELNSAYTSLFLLF